METPDADAEHLSRVLEGLAAELGWHVGAIAAALSGPLPRNAAAVADACHQVARVIRSFPPLHRQVTAAHARAAAEARQADTRLSPAWHALIARANGLRTATARWSLVQGLVAAQNPPRRRPLYLPPADMPEILQSQAEAGDAVISILQALLTPGEQDASAAAHGCFADIAMPQSRFLAHAHAARRVMLAQGKERGGFLDVGCGGGITLLAATQFFTRVAGIEIDPGYAQAAQRLLQRAGRRDVLIVQRDAALFDDYAAFDVIYLFRPMRDADGMRRLERVVLAQARPGAVVIAPYRGFHARHEDLGCARIDGHLFLAGAGADDAARLREAAEHTGPSLMRCRPALPDLWEPILATSAGNGFSLPGESWVDSV